MMPSDALRSQLKASLHVVGGGTPEQELSLLFRRERDLERELAGIRADIAAQRRAYATREGLITPPRVEFLRQWLLP